MFLNKNAMIYQREVRGTNLSGCNLNGCNLSGSCKLGGGDLSTQTSDVKNLIGGSAVVT